MDLKRGDDMLNKQAFLNAIYQDIDMVRGDTLAFNFIIAGLGNLEPTFSFTCKNHYEDDSALFSCVSGYGIERVKHTEKEDTFVVWVDPVKTKNLDLARYYYDLEMQCGDDIITLMRGRLTLLWEATKGAE